LSGHWHGALRTSAKRQSRLSLELAEVDIDMVAIREAIVVTVLELEHARVALTQA